MGHPKDGEGLDDRWTVGLTRRFLCLIQFSETIFDEGNFILGLNRNYRVHRSGDGRGGRSRVRETTKKSDGKLT